MQLPYFSFTFPTTKQINKRRKQTSPPNHYLTSKLPIRALNLLQRGIPTDLESRIVVRSSCPDWTTGSRSLYAGEERTIRVKGLVVGAEELGSSGTETEAAGKGRGRKVEEDEGIG